MKWIEFLMKPSRRKAKRKLDAGDGNRCCLGHGCYILNIDKEISAGTGNFLYEGHDECAPYSFVAMVGLWDDLGSSGDGNNMNVFKDNNPHNMADTLASINDDTSASPQRIGKYLLSVVEGGKNTPFKPLSDYK